MQRNSSTCLARLGLPHDRGVRDGGPAHCVLTGQAAQAGAVYVAVLHPLRACSNRTARGMAGCNKLPALLHWRLRLHGWSTWGAAQLL